MFQRVPILDAVLAREGHAITLEEQGGVHPELVWSLGSKEAFAEQLFQATLEAFLTHVDGAPVQAVIEEKEGQAICITSCHLRSLILGQYRAEDTRACLGQIECCPDAFGENLDEVLFVSLLNGVDHRCADDLARLRVQQVAGALLVRTVLVEVRISAPAMKGFSGAVVEAAKVYLLGLDNCWPGKSRRFIRHNGPQVLSSDRIIIFRRKTKSKAKLSRDGNFLSFEFQILSFAPL